MREHPYDPLSVEQPHRSIVEQLATAFPNCAIWERHENYDRWLSVGLIDKASGNSLTVPLIYAGIRRTWKFHEVEIEAFRRRLMQLE